MSQKYDIVVIMGSGFKSGEDDNLGRFGMARCLKAIELYKAGKTKKIILTGWLRHEKTRVSFIEKALVLCKSYGVKKEDIIVPLYNPKINTIGDLEQMFEVLYRNFRFYRSCNVGIITEAPHWLRTRHIIKMLNPHNCKCKFSLIISCPAPWRYWVKEIILYIGYGISPHIARQIVELWHKNDRSSCFCKTISKPQIKIKIFKKEQKRIR